MKAPITCFTRALCIFALTVQITACGDDDDNKSATKPDEASKSSAGAPTDTKPGGREMASAGAAGTGGTVLTKTTCLAGASRFPQAAPECASCVCETIAACGAACQDLLVCAVTSCSQLLGDSVSVATCALKNCAAQANAPGAAIGLTEALAGIGACQQACAPPPPPAFGEPDASTPDTSDAGASESPDAG